MTMRVRYKSQVQVSATIDDDRWAGQPESSVLSDELEDGGTNLYTIRNGDVDIEVVPPAGPDLCNFIYIKTYSLDPNEDLGDLSVKINDVAVGVIRPLPGAKEAEWKLCTADVESVKLSNASGFDIRIVVSLAGVPD